MYLESLKINGFKSFAKKTTFKFNHGMTAIVGPNGCGKSNIVDAIRWALGEQKAGVIRSERMENVIFNGTKTTKPLGMAEVSLVIQNTRNILPIEYSEVVVTRRLFRSMESQYLLNNTPCRLKDIQDLFMDTGLGPDTYSIIELSMIDTILNGRAEERRRIIEEAAGVTKYKMRRKAAFRKLEATAADLVRVNDIISEIEKNVNSLKRQVKKAQRHQEFSDSLKEKEIQLATQQFSQIQFELEPLTQTLHESQDTRVSISARLDEKEAEIEEKRTKLLGLERDLSSRQKELNELSAKIQDKEEEILVSRERRKALENAIGRMGRDKEETDEKLRKNQMLIARSKEQVQELFEKIQLSENDYQEKNKDLSALELRFHEKNDHLKGLENKRLQAVEGLTETKQEEERIKTQLENIDRRIDALNKEIEENKLLEKIRQEKISKLSEQEQKFDKNFQELKDKLKVIKEDLERLGNVKETAKEKILNRRGELQTLKERIELLKKFIESYEDHPEGVQHILLHGPLNGGCKGTLADNLKVKSAYRRAVETAMGDASVSLIVEGTEQALQCIELLKANDKGAVTFLPLDRFTNGREKNGYAGEVLQSEGVIDWAYNLVDCSDDYRPLVHSLLDEYLVVQDLDTARKQAEKFSDQRINLITLNGEVVSSWGPIRGGENEKSSAGVIGRKALVEELQKELKEVFSQLDRDENERQEIENKYQEALKKASELTTQQKFLEQQIRDVEVRLAQLQFESRKSSESIEKLLQDISSHQNDGKELRRQYEAIFPSLKNLVDNKSGFEVELQKISGELSELEERVNEQRTITQDSRVQLADLKSEERHVQENITRLYEYDKELRDSVIRTDEEIEAATLEQEELSKKIDENKGVIETEFEQHQELSETVHRFEQKYFDGKETLDKEERAVREFRNQKDQASDELHAVELRVSELRTNAENIKSRIKDEYNVTLKKQPVDDEFDLEIFSDEISGLKNRIESMGPVNLLALKEFEKEKERFDFLQTQKNDLIEAEQNLNETIQVINKTARDQFMEIFEKIQENFSAVFSNFFENGQARLKLAPNEDPLEADVIIEADPRGKRISALSLLSGGEKTLTALSLLFAIYLVKPSPFCILDEVDAPLDDANIGRFIKAIHDFSDKTQFIIVTHNKLSMKASNCLYGITMQEHGVSKVVSVNFQDMQV